MWNIHSMLLNQKKGKCLQLVVRRRRRGRGVVEVVLVYTSSVAEQRTRTWVCYIHTRTHGTARARARERVRYDRASRSCRNYVDNLAEVDECCHPQSYCHRGNIILEKYSWNSKFIIGYTRCSRSGRILYTVATLSKQKFRTDEL